MSEPLYVPPEWVLLVADPATAAPLERALVAESITVRQASDYDRFERLLRLGRPAAAVVDLDHPFGLAAIRDLAARGVLAVALSADPERLRAVQSLVPTGMEKPVGVRAFTRTVDGLLGRR
jgi:DNA-binding response OmpR family regulator